MNNFKTVLTRFVIPVVTPFFILMTAVRLLLVPIYPSLEYRTPNFPPDPYGFTFAERVHWSRYAVAYLVNDADISYLGVLAFQDGSPLYNTRELSHMVDVKNIVQGMLTVWYLFGVLLMGVGIWAWRTGWLAVFWWSLARGGVLTIVFIALILVGVLVGFRAVFTGFHRIFFEGDTWLFLYSDTLIRLFPMRFWQDSFIYVGILALIGALLLICLGRRERASKG